MLIAHAVSLIPSIAIRKSQHLWDVATWPFASIS
jgi:hypothetical protein